MIIKLTQKGIKKAGSPIAWWGVSVIEHDIVMELNRRRKLGLSREALGDIFRGAGAARIDNALRVLRRKGFVRRKLR